MSAEATTTHPTTTQFAATKRALRIELPPGLRGLVRGTGLIGTGHGFSRGLSRGKGRLAARLDTDTTLGWTRASLAGRLTELGGHGAVATLTAAFSLVLDAQRQGETVAWVSRTADSFFPPDAAACGVDLDALAVVRVPDPAAVARCADRLLRSGAFGLVILDLCVTRESLAADIPTALQARLAGLAREHDTALVCLTSKHREAPSMGSLVQVRVEASRRHLREIPIPMRGQREAAHDPARGHRSRHGNGPLGTHDDPSGTDAAAPTFGAAAFAPGAAAPMPCAAAPTPAAAALAPCRGGSPDPPAVPQGEPHARRRGGPSAAHIPGLPDGSTSRQRTDQEVRPRSEAEESAHRPADTPKPARHSTPPPNAITPPAPYLLQIRATKDKGRVPGWTHQERCRGPAGLR